MNNCPNVHQFTEIPSIDTFLIDFDKNTSKPEATIVHHSEQEVIDHIARTCKFLIACGGLVQHTESKQYLFIHRLGKWDLPKGKLEADESFEECAVREVEEECGIKNLQIQNHLPSSYHTYWLKDQFIVKETRWFAMITDQTETKPQTEEQITESCWKSISDFDVILSNTYPAIAQLLNDVLHH